MAGLYRIEKHHGFVKDSKPYFVAGVIARSYSECSDLMRGLAERICEPSGVMAAGHEYLTMQYIKKV